MKSIDEYKYSVMFYIILHTVSSIQKINYGCAITTNKQLCPSEFARTIKGSYQSFSYESSKCTNGTNKQICNIFTGKSSSLTLSSCSVNYNNEKCTPNVCYKYSGSLCSQDSVCNSLSTGDKNFIYSCKACQTISDCSFCLFVSQSSIQTQKSCLGEACPSWLSENVEINYTTCQQKNKTKFDDLGQSCTCCLKSSKQVPLCLTENQYLNNSNLTIWFYRAQALFQCQLFYFISPIFLMITLSLK